MSAVAPDTPPRGASVWIGMAVGIPVFAFGIAGALVNSRATQPVKFATWLVGADVAHDAIVAPVVGLVGWLLVRLVRKPWRAPIRAGLIASACAVAVAWAPLHGYGRIPDNPSLSPLDYATAVLTAIGIVWAVCTVWIAVIALRRRSAREPSPPESLS